jgi:uncharacterized protein YecT (DUF1311 family)
MHLLALALSAALAARIEPDGVDCGGTTIELDQCLAGVFEKVDAEHLRYVAAARARLQHEAETAIDDPGPARAAQGFEAAETAWLAYRKAECGAVYDNYSGGTIRGSMELSCRLHLTRLRTHTVWLNWLTYFDSTPPVLPEPVVPPARGE